MKKWSRKQGENEKEVHLSFFEMTPPKIDTLNIIFIIFF